MSNVNYQEKLALISTGLADILSCLQHISSSQLEIINKVKNIHALGVKTRAKELSVIHEAMDVDNEWNGPKKGRYSCVQPLLFNS